MSSQKIEFEKEPESVSSNSISNLSIQDQPEFEAGSSRLDVNERPGDNFTQNALTNVESAICRICHNSDDRDRLITPCHCRGSLNFVHRRCIENWFNYSGTSHCEICMYRFSTQHTLRYQRCESLRIWFNHPIHRMRLQTDVLVGSMLTVITFALTLICIFGFQYILLQGNNLVHSNWTLGAIIFFSILLLLAYVVNLFLIIKGQLLPWHRWWRRSRIVTLVFNNNIMDDTNNTSNLV